MAGRKKTSGFSMVEILIVVSILGMLAMIAVPSYINSRSCSQATAVADNFRTYAAAFQIYCTEKGAWPPDAMAGMVPQGMEGHLPRFNEEAVIGGRWDWESGTDSPKASISLVNYRSNHRVVQQVDRILDDGNLSTGLILGHGNRLTLVLEP